MLNDCIAMMNEEKTLMGIFFRQGNLIVLRHFCSSLKKSDFWSHICDKVSTKTTYNEDCLSALLCHSFQESLMVFSILFSLLALGWIVTLCDNSIICRRRKKDLEKDIFLRLNSFFMFEMWNLISLTSFLLRRCLLILADM